MVGGVECDFQGRRGNQAFWFVLLLSSLHAARNFKGMAAGQVAMLEYKVTLRDTLCCSTDRNLCVSLGLASFGIPFYERDTLLT